MRHITVYLFAGLLVAATAAAGTPTTVYLDEMPIVAQSLDITRTDDTPHRAIIIGVTPDEYVKWSQWLLLGSTHPLSFVINNEVPGYELSGDFPAVRVAALRVDRNIVWITFDTHYNWPPEW